MKSTNSFIKKGKKAIQDDLRREFVLSSKDETFMKLCARLKIDEKILIYFISSICFSLFFGIVCFTRTTLKRI